MGKKDLRVYPKLGNWSSTPAPVGVGNGLTILLSVATGSPHMTANAFVKRWRQENLLSLLGQYSRRELCQRTGLATSQISQLATNQREIDDTTARQLEKSLNLPAGWMDLSHSTLSLQAERNLEALPLEERILLAKFRQLDPTAQVHVRAIIDAFLTAKR